MQLSAGCIRTRIIATVTKQAAWGEQYDKNTAETAAKYVAKFEFFGEFGNARISCLIFSAL
jgi:hypothetical protein